MLDPEFELQKQKRVYESPNCITSNSRLCRTVAQTGRGGAECMEWCVMKGPPMGLAFSCLHYSLATGDPNGCRASQNPRRHAFWRGLAGTVDECRNVNWVGCFTDRACRCSWICHEAQKVRAFDSHTSEPRLQERTCTRSAVDWCRWPGGGQELVSAGKFF